MSQRVSFLALLAFVVACAGPQSPDAEFALVLERGPGLHPGVVKFVYTPVSVELPETVAAGQAFDITVSTYGNGCFSQGETVVSQTSAASVLIEPFDEVFMFSGDVAEGELFVCNSIGHRFYHTVTVRFDRSGFAFVTVRGWALPEDEPFEAKYTIVVQ